MNAKNVQPSHSCTVCPKENDSLILSIQYLIVRKDPFVKNAQTMNVTRSQHDRNQYLIEHNRAMETGEPSIEDSLEFHDNHLLEQAWKISTYNKERDKSRQQRQDKDIDMQSSRIRRSQYQKEQQIEEETIHMDVRKDIIQNAMWFQPMSGYCAMATVNTMLRSLNGSYYIPYPNQGRGYSMMSLAKFLILNCSPFPFDDIDVIFMQTDTTLSQFRTILQDYANNPNYRLLANFHRTPLFYSSSKTKEEEEVIDEQTLANRAYAGHWSPVGGLITDDQTKNDYVLVLDTNERYGPFMVSLERFFRAVKTQTLQDGYRGFIRVRINPNF